MSAVTVVVAEAGPLPGHVSRAFILRQELKEWEARFAQENEGRKVSREEIKRVPDVAAKYSEYRKLREGVDVNHSSRSPKRAVTVKNAATPRKRSRDTHAISQEREDSRKEFDTKPQTPRRSRKQVSTKHSRQDAPYQRDSKATPSKTSSAKNNTRLNDDGIEDAENVPPAPTFIGPTPQKDGRVLGLFDLLSPVAKTQTPTKTRMVLGITTGRNTPRKLANYEEHGASIDLKTSPWRDTEQDIKDVFASGHKHSRSPQSASKRYLLDAFVTPSKRRRLDDFATTPTSIPKVDSDASLALGTPAFLRRQSSLQVLPTVAEDENGLEDGGIGLSEQQAAQVLNPSISTQVNWLKRRPIGPGLVRSRSTGIGRSLSSMIADMRQAEEDRMDDEMALLREMEDGPSIQTRHATDRNNNKNSSHAAHQEQATSKAVLNEPLLEESQLFNTEADLKLLGPDRAADASDEEDMAGEGVGRDGLPLRVWKKKGMKRQTRKVLLRPNTRKPQTTDQQATTKSTISAGDDDPTEIVAETQLQEPLSYSSDEAEPNNNEDDEGNATDTSSTSTHTSTSSTYSTQPRTAKRTSLSRAKPTLITTTSNLPPQHPATEQATATTNHETKEKENPIKKAAKKISASAHANFRKLKIRSAKGAAGAKVGVGRFGGRFGGKRR